MSDNNATVTTQEGTAEQQERTFTQAELDSIVKDRLAREKGKYADYEELKAKATKFDEFEEAQKSELQKVTERADALQAQLDQMTKADSIRKVREKVSADTGVPVNLLSGETEDDCKTQAEAVLAFAKTAGYPNVKDAGEVHSTSTGKTRDQFADWFNQSMKR